MSGAPATASFASLGTTAVVAVTDPATLEPARALLAADLDAVDRACSRFRDDSELTWANACAGTRVPVGRVLAGAVRVALDAARSSDGLVDPTLGAQLRAAGYDRTFALVRERDGWRVGPAPARGPGWLDVELDDEQRTLLVPKGVELDLGATAKAWAADRAVRRIASATGSGALVSPRRRRRGRGAAATRRAGRCALPTITRPPSSVRDRVIADHGRRPRHVGHRRPALARLTRETRTTFSIHGPGGPRSRRGAP